MFHFLTQQRAWKCRKIKFHFDKIKKAMIILKDIVPFNGNDDDNDNILRGDPIFQTRDLNCIKLGVMSIFMFNQQPTKAKK